jgi:hypothetical protein
MEARGLLQEVPQQQMVIRELHKLLHIEQQFKAVHAVQYFLIQQ